MDTIESEIMILYQSFKNSKECAKRLYDKIVVLQNYEDSYNYKSVLNSAYLKRKVSKVLFGIKQYNDNFDKDLIEFNNLSSPLSSMEIPSLKSSHTQPSKTKVVKFDEPIKTDVPDEIVQDMSNMLNMDDEELEKVKNMNIVDQQEYLINKFLSDDEGWDVNAHINERRPKVEDEPISISQVLENKDAELEKLKYIRNLQNAVLDDFEVDDNASTSTLSDNIE